MKLRAMLNMAEGHGKFRVSVGPVLRPHDHLRLNFACGPLNLLLNWDLNMQNRRCSQVGPSLMAWYRTLSGTVDTSLVTGHTNLATVEPSHLVRYKPMPESWSCN